MSIQWKPVVVSALGALFVAIMSAGISGVSFGVLVVRALIGALMFGAGAVGIQFLVERFLPELASYSRQSAPGGAEDADYSSEQGGSVDIVISDEDDGDLAAESESTFAESEGPMFEPGLPGTRVFGDSDDEPLVEEVQEVEASTDRPDEDEESDQDAGTAVDTLPDMGEFTDSFMADTSTEKATGTGGSTGRDGQDPEAIAQAIRTLIKREES